MIRILFVGTRNNYRSRFAEAYVNNRALEEKLPITAFSVGLDADKKFLLEKELIHELNALNISFDINRIPTQVERFHLENFDHIIAMDESEQRELIRSKFPLWENKISYWMVHDKSIYTPKKAIQKIKTLIDNYIEQELLAYK